LQFQKADISYAEDIGPLNSESPQKRKTQYQIRKEQIFDQLGEEGLKSWQAYRAAKSSLYRYKMTEVQKLSYNRKAAIRQREYRKRLKEKEKKPITRKELSAKREYWKLAKRRSREVKSDRERLVERLEKERRNRTLETLMEDVHLELEKCSPTKRAEMQLKGIYSPNFAEKV